MKQIFITGANGFVGRALLRRLCTRYKITAQVRKLPENPVSSVNYCVIDSLHSVTDWADYLENIDHVVHLAAAVHGNDQAFQAINCDATTLLAKACAEAGVQRMIYVSTLHVLGQRSVELLNEQSQAKPHSEYAKSKLAAELKLQAVLKGTMTQWTILRPPLIYGPGVKGNLASLLNWLKKGLPAPFAALTMKRSMLGLENFLDIIELALEHPNAANQLFVLRDVDISMATLFRRLASLSQSRSKLFWCPRWLLVGLLSLLGKHDKVNSLCYPLLVDDSSIQQRLNWTPRFSTDEQFLQMLAKDEP